MSLIWIPVALAAVGAFFWCSLRVVDSVRARRFRRRVRYDARRQLRYRAWVETYKEAE